MKKTEVSSDGGGLEGLIGSIKDKALLALTLLSLGCAHTVPVKSPEFLGVVNSVEKCTMNCNRKYLGLLTGSASQREEGRVLVEGCWEECEEE